MSLPTIWYIVATITPSGHRDVVKIGFAMIPHASQQSSITIKAHGHRAQQKRADIAMLLQEHPIYYAIRKCSGKLLAPLTMITKILY